MGVHAHGNSSSFAGQGLSNPELTDLASFTGQLALGILCPCFKKPKLQVGCYTAQNLQALWEFELLKLLWQALERLSYFRAPGHCSRESLCSQM